MVSSSSTLIGHDVTIEPVVSIAALDSDVGNCSIEDDKKLQRSGCCCSKHVAVEGPASCNLHLFLDGTATIDGLLCDVTANKRNSEISHGKMERARKRHCSLETGLKCKMAAESSPQPSSSKCPILPLLTVCERFANRLAGTLNDTLTNEALLMHLISLLAQQKAFTAERKPANITVAFHHTNIKNAERLRQSGFMASHYKNDLVLTPVVHAGENNIRDVVAVVAILKGNARRVGPAFGGEDSSEDLDSVIRNTELHDWSKCDLHPRFHDEIIPRHFSQCLPLCFVSGGEGTLGSLWTCHCDLQKLNRRVLQRSSIDSSPNTNNGIRAAITASRVLCNYTGVATYSLSASG